MGSGGESAEAGSAAGGRGFESCEHPAIDMLRAIEAARILQERMRLVPTTKAGLGQGIGRAEVRVDGAMVHADLGALIGRTDGGPSSGGAGGGFGFGATACGGGVVKLWAGRCSCWRCHGYLMRAW